MIHVADIHGKLLYTLAKLIRLKYIINVLFQPNRRYTSNVLQLNTLKYTNAHCIDQFQVQYENTNVIS